MRLSLPYVASKREHSRGPGRGYSRVRRGTACRPAVTTKRRVTHLDKVRMRSAFARARPNQAGCIRHMRGQLALLSQSFLALTFGTITEALLTRENSVVAPTHGTIMWLQLYSRGGHVADAVRIA